MTSDNANHLIETIEQLINQGNYREAYKRWQRLRQLSTEGALISINIHEVREQIEREAVNRSRDIALQLEKLLAVTIGDFDTHAAESELDRLYDVSIDDLEQDYRQYRERVDNRKREQARRRLYEQTRNEIENLWQEARNLGQDETQIAADALLPYYTQARDYAERIANENPDNRLLQELAKRTRDERERLGGEQEVMTSGGQLGDYKRVLQYIHDAPDDEPIMVYSAGGLPLGRMLKDKARETVIEQARIYIAGKLDEYLDEVDRLLKDHDPRGAQTELARAEDMVTIEDMAPDIVSTTQRGILADRQTAVRNELSQLERAEETARRALRERDRDLLAAWRMLQEARDSYAGVTTHSSVLIENTEAIEDATVAYLQEQINDAERMIEQFQFAEAHDLLSKLHADFSNIKSTRTKTQVDAIKRAMNACDQRLRDQRSVSDQLTRIYRAAATNSATALEDLQALEREFPKLTPRDPQYDQVREAVSGAVDDDEEYARLSAFLTSTDASRVRNAADTARNNSHRDTRFGTLAGWLDLQAEYLDALTSIRRGSYESGIATISNLLGEPNLPDTLKNPIQKRLMDLQRQRMAMEANEDHLNTARHAIDSMHNDLESGIRDAWNALNRIENFEGTQALEWEKLLIRSFEQMTIRITFDAEVLRSLLRRLEEINPPKAEQWRMKLKTLQSAQTAREQAATGNNDGALQLWQRIQKDNQVGGEDVLYVMRQINDIQKKKKRAEIEYLRVDYPGESDRLIEWLADLDELSKELKELSTQYSDSDIDMLDYAIWASEVELLYAQHTQAATDKHKALISAANYIKDSIEGRIRKFERSRRRDTAADGGIRETLERAKLFIRRAEIATRLAAAITAMENHLVVDKRITPNSFARAHQEWQAAITSAQSDEHEDNQQAFFGPLLVWFENRRQALLKELRVKLGTTIEGKSGDILPPEALPLLAKVAILDKGSDEALRISDELSRLEQNFANQMQMFVSNLATGQQASGDNGLEILEAQITQAYDLQALMKGAEQIITLFTEMPDMLPQSPQANLNDITQDYLNILRRIGERLTIIKNAAQSYEIRMQNFHLTEASLATFNEEFDKDLKEFDQTTREQAEQIVQALKDSGRLAQEFRRGDFISRHPVVRYLKAEKDRMVEKYDSIRSTLRLLQTMIKEQRFDEAMALIEQVSNNEKEQFRAFHNSADLLDTFTVRDVWGDRDITGWEEIETWVRQRQESWQRIADWSDTFYNEDSNNPVESVVNWDTVQDREIQRIITELGAAASTDPYTAIVSDPQVRAYLEDRADTDDFTDAVRYQVWLDMARGYFDLARERLETAIHGGTHGEKTLPESLNAVQIAFDMVSQVPLADAENDRTTDEYDEAIQRAGSQKGAERIRWMREHRLQVYRRWLNEAAAIRTRIDDYEQQWQALHKTFHDQLAELGFANEQYRRQRLRRTHWRKEIERVREEIDNTFREMDHICPRNPEIENLRANPLLD